MWIQLVQPKYIEEKGVQRKCNAGDWVEVGKQTALLWLSDGSATIPNENDFQHLSGSDAIIVTDDKEYLKKALPAYPALQVHEALTPELHGERNAWIKAGWNVRQELIPVGFSMLDSWQMAVPLMDYKILAQHLGDDTERRETEKVVRDLRCLVYDTRLIFARNEKEPQEVFKLWRKYRFTDLGFLRALYEVKPFILALPSTWTLGRPKRNEE
jgi:hypothetical protein